MRRSSGSGGGGIGRLEGLYNKVTADRPDDARSLNVKSVMAFDNDRPAEAAELIGRAIALEPGERTYLFHMAKVCARAEWWHQAATALRRAIYVDPQDPESWYGLGAAFLELGSPEQSAVCLRQCLALEPGHAGAEAALAGLKRR